jgi:GAF domain-containing protein
MARVSPRKKQSLLELERQYELLRHQQERDRNALDILYRIGLLCRGQTSFKGIFESIYHELRVIFDLDACYVALCDTDHLGQFRAALLADEGKVDYDEQVKYSRLTGLILERHEPLLFHDLIHEREQLNIDTKMFGNLTRKSRSWLGVPLLVGSDAVGVITLQSYTPGIYNAADVDLLQRIGNVVAVALENVKLVQHQRTLSAALADQVAARTRELEVLTAIAAETVSRQSLPELLDHALRLILPLLELDGGSVQLLDAQQQALVLLAQHGFSAEYSQEAARALLANSPLRRVAIDNQPLVIANNCWETLSGYTNVPRFESMLSVPLRIGARVLGTLNVFGLTKHDFDIAEIDLAQAIGNQIAIAIQTARLFDEGERQIAELRALGSMSHAASTAHDPQTLLRQVHDALREFLQIDAFAMVIYDPERGVVTDGLSIDEGYEYFYWKNTPPPPDSLTSWIINQRKPLRFNNVPDEIVRYHGLKRHSIGSQRAALSWLGAPCFDRDDRVIGVITLQGYQPAIFDERDEAFLINVARQVALHVQNVRLLTQRERQIRELDAIGQIGQMISASFDLDEMLQVVHNTLDRLTQASIFYLLICEPETYIVTNAIFFEEGQQVTLHMEGASPDLQSLSGWIMRQREPLLFQDLVGERDQLIQQGIIPRLVSPKTPARSWVGVPLLAKDGEPIGVLSLQDYKAYCYDEQTIELLNQVASHVSLGIQKVRLFEERERQVRKNARLFTEARAHAEAAQEQAKRMELVHRITALLNTRLDQQEILELAASELVQLFWADHIGIILFDDEMEWGTVVSEYPYIGSLGVRVPLQDNLIMQEFLASYHPICITAIETDPRAEVSRAIWRALGITSVMILPLTSRDRVIGFIGLDILGRPHTWTEEEQNLFLTVARSIATALENARLFTAEHEARHTADTLREVARVLSSTFDPQEVLQLILRELQHLVPYDTASIMLVEGEVLRVVASCGWEGSSYDPRALVLPLHQPSGAAMAVHQRHPIVLADTRTEPYWLPNVHLTQTRSWLGVPLIAKGAVLGVLNIDAYETDRFTHRDIEVASAFANQAAVALENAQLYQESVTRVEQELEIARQIQHNLFPRELPRVAGLTLAAECLPAYETGGDFYDVVVLNAQRIGVLVGDVSGKSIPAAMLMAVARSIARSEARDHETPSIVMRETNRLLADDMPPHTFVALSYAILDVEQRKLYLTNAGQLAPLRRRADGQVEYLETSGSTLPLGMLPDIEYHTLEVTLESGDLLVFYTDGIVEARDRRRQLFGFEWLELLTQKSAHLPPDAFIDHVLQTLQGFAAGVTQHDDLTLVVIRVE